MSTLVPTGSITAIMDELVKVEESVSDQLPVYRWKPVDAVDLEFGAIYNWLTDAPYEIFDVAHWKDNFRISARVGIRHVDDVDDMLQLERYADAFRDVLDGALYSNRPLGGAVRRARRTGMRMVSDDFSGVPVRAIDFPLELETLRLIPAG